MKIKNPNPKKGRLDRFETWQVVTGLVVIAIILYSVFQFAVEPRLENWLGENLLPQAYGVQKALQAKYPDDEINVDDQSYYNGSSRERTLEVTVANSSAFPDTLRKASIKADICAALGQNIQAYDRLVLQSAVQHNYLIFYYRKNQSEAFTC